MVGENQGGVVKESDPVSDSGYSLRSAATTESIVIEVDSTAR